MLTRLPFFILFMFLFANLVRAEDDSLKNASGKNLRILPVPMLWYTPETRFGLGAAAMFNFRFNKNNPVERVSSVQIGEAFTQEKQWINFSSFQLFPWKERLFIYGEAGYYRYRYYFYDIGNNNEDGKKENYDIDFTRIRSNFLYKCMPHFYAGIRYWLEKSEASSNDTSGYLLNGNYTGFPSAFTSSPGLVFLFDSRDHIFFPTNGWFTEFAFQNDSEKTGSNFNFSRISIDASRYFPLKKKHVLAFNFHSVYTAGDVPFTQLAMLGGNKKMRGYYEGSFRDKCMMLLQSEVRMQIFPRWFLNVFFSAGNVAEKFSYLQIKHTRFSGGLGLRFRIDVKNKIPLRLDAAFGSDGIKNYFTFNEAY